MSTLFGASITGSSFNSSFSISILLVFESSFSSLIECSSLLCIQSLPSEQFDDISSPLCTSGGVLPVGVPGGDDDLVIESDLSDTSV